MSKLRNLIILAIIANLTTILLFEFGQSHIGKSNFSSFSIALCIIGLWFITIIVALTHTKNGNLFKTEISVWAIFVIMFCTPFPLLGVYQALNPVQEKGDNLTIVHNLHEKLLIHNILTPAQKKLAKAGNNLHKVRQ